MTLPAPKCKLQHDLRHHIAACALFSDLPDTVIQEFCDVAQLRHLKKGQVVYLQDDEAEWFYLIVHGWIKLFRETMEGSEAIIDVLTNGHTFGDTSVFEDGRYSYAVEVVEDAALICLPTSLLRDTIATHHQLALNMLTSMSRHRLQQHREIEHLNVQNAPQRIGCFLLRLCPTRDTGSVTLHLPYDKTLIAGRLGMKPETFSRALAKLKDDSSIQISGPTVHIKSVQALVDYTCSHCSSTFPCDDLR